MKDMEDQNERKSVSSKTGVGRSHSFSTFYMPSKRMGEYIPVHYRRVSYDRYDLAYDRYYTESHTITAAELLNSLNRRCKTGATADVDQVEKERIQRSKLPDYFTKKEERDEVEAQTEKIVEPGKNRLRYTGGYTDVSNWEGSNTGKQYKMKRWDSLGVLGLVCRLYREREETKENEEKEKKEEMEKKEEECNSNNERKEDDKAKCRCIKIEREEEVSNDDSEETQHQESTQDEEEFFSEDENEYYWD